MNIAQSHATHQDLFDLPERWWGRSLPANFTPTAGPRRHMPRPHPSWVTTLASHSIAVATAPAAWRILDEPELHLNAAGVTHCWLIVPFAAITLDLAGLWVD